MYHYNTNSSAIATALKTRENKTFKEIEHLFEEPFLAEDHRHFKVGYDKNLGVSAYYIYVPWQKIRDRIDAIVGKEGWNLQVTGFFQDDTGIPVFCGRMTILGVVKEGLGFGKSKEGWQGSKSEIAYADLLKNCAEQFGFCRYLDDQGFTIEHLFKSRDQLTRAMAQQLLPYYQKKQQEQRKELGLPAEGNMLAAEKERRQQKSVASRSTEVRSRPAGEVEAAPRLTLISPPRQTESAKTSSNNEPDFSGMLAWLRQGLLKCASYRIDQDRIDIFCRAAGCPDFESLPLKSKQVLTGKILLAFLQETNRSDQTQLVAIANNFSQLEPNEAAKSAFKFVQMLEAVEQF